MLPNKKDKPGNIGYYDTEAYLNKPLWSHGVRALWPIATFIMGTLWVSVMIGGFDMAMADPKLLWYTEYDAEWARLAKIWCEANPGFIYDHFDMYPYREAHEAAKPWLLEDLNMKFGNRLGKNHIVFNARFEASSDFVKYIADRESNVSIWGRIVSLYNTLPNPIDLIRGPRV